MKPKKTQTNYPSKKKKPKNTALLNLVLFSYVMDPVVHHIRYYSCQCECALSTLIDVQKQQVKLYIIQESP